MIEPASERGLASWDRPLEAVLGKPWPLALPETSGQGFEVSLTAVLRTDESLLALALSVGLWRG